MLLIGVTGNIAAGKSQVSYYFRQKGACVIDADMIGHYLLDNAPQLRKELVHAFGDDILDAMGYVSRKLLGAIAFAGAEQLRTLNNIFYPYITNQILQEIHQAQRIYQIIVLDAALIVEWRFQARLHHLVAVLAEDRIRLERLSVMSRLSPEEAERRMRLQLPQGEKAKAAGHVINNNGTLEELERRTDEVWRKISGVGD
jgi:dephospho-CoA kinase